jgi:anaerobic magnesium-protoporphyrin IX monomethyl ester cyclase
MLDVLFVEPNSAKKSYQGLADVYAAVETPTWSLLLAESCRSKGFAVNILDANAERLEDDYAVEIIAKENPRLACFVVYGQNPNSGTTNMSGALSLAQSLKDRHPHIKICFVGSHMSALPREVLSYSFVDIVLTNEGVYALHNLLANKGAPFYSLKGIGWKPEPNRIVINEPEKIVPQDKMDEDLPGYAWDLLPYKEKPFDLYRAHFWHSNYEHEGRSPFAAIYTSLGCNFKCEFCMINILNRTDNSEDAVSSDFNVMRYWSTDFILKEFDKLQSYGVKNLRISDEMFFLKKNHFLPLVKELAEREYKFNMWAYSRIDTCREQYLPLFKKAGINWLAVGIEAANPVIRQQITKGKFEDVNIRQVVKLIQDNNIKVVGNYIFGFPNEKKEDLQKTLDLAIELNCEFGNFYCAAALPGSPLYKKAIENGWALPDNFAAWSFYSYECKPLPTNYLTPREVLEFRDKAWLKYNKNTQFLSMIGEKFGAQARRNIEEKTKIKLKRKLLED